MNGQYSRFEDMFREATGYENPFPYQIDMATRDVLPQLVDIPTGVKDERV